MAKIPSTNTKPELIVRKFLFSKGFRYRVNDPRLPGKPDIVLPKYRTVVFVNGCFWHGHQGCGRSKLPKTNANFWKNKIGDNIERDKLNEELLKKGYWRVIVLWECQLKSKSSRNTVLNDLIHVIQSLS